jgi:chromate transporter
MTPIWRATNFHRIDSAVTPAVVGVVLNLAVWFGLHVIFPSPGTVDSFAILAGIVAFAGMVRWKWDIVPVVLIPGFAGLIFKMFSSHLVK